MRILHVIPYMHPSAGGPPVVVENFVREAIRLGHLSEIISTPLFCEGDQQSLLQRLNEVAQTTFLSETRAFLPRIRGVAPLRGPSWCQLGQSIRAADIVHVHTLWNPINLMVRQECASLGRPYVLMPHGMLDPYSLKVKRWRKALYLWAIERRNILTAQRLIYATEEEARLAATGLLPLPKAVIIPLGGDAPAENSVALASGFIEKFPRARGRRQLLFLGRLHFKKGLDRILLVLPSIVEKFPDVLLTIVGDGTPDFEAMLKGNIVRDGLENNVMLTGRLDGAAKWGAYASAELFLLPSRQENFAITVAEAMQMAVPVVLSNKVNTWSHVKEAGAGIVLDEERIVGDLEKSIVSLMRDKGDRRLMGKRGQSYARKNLTWSGAGKRIVRCYEDVLTSQASY
jgi:glycosyltransferase involved in cell wall biosynthesis